MSTTAPQDANVHRHTQRLPPLVRLRLFGGFRAERDGGPPLPRRWSRPSAQILVKLLAVTPNHSLHRGQIQEICWPDATPQAATNSLRVALHAARHALEPELAPRASSSYLLSDGSMLRLHPRHVWIDTDEAEELSLAALASPSSEAALASPSAASTEAALTAALAAYTGEFLPEDRYTAWAGPCRDRLAESRLGVLLALAGNRLASGRHEAAAATARQALAAFPAEERAHQVLMSASLGQGLRTQAVRQYELCREALSEELGIEPSPETERLRALAVRTATIPAPRSAEHPTDMLPAPARAAAREPLYGRDELLTRLLADGDHPVVLLSGEAGLGKTRLAGHAARRLAESGAVVLWGATHDAEGHTPYGPFVEALDGWLVRRPPHERARLAADCPELAPLLPSLRPVMATPVPPSDGNPATEGAVGARTRLFHAVEQLLTAIAGDNGVIVVLDDLHAADAGTFHLLTRLARRRMENGTPHCRFLVTCRDDEPAPAADPLHLERLVSSGLARRVAVPRLARTDSDAVVRDTLAGLGRPVDGGHLDHIWRLSLGNPLFAVELANARAPQQNDDPADPPAPVGVRQLVADRLARVAPDVRRMTEVVAVARGTAPLSEVLDVARHGLHPPLTEAEASAALESAVSASLLDEQRITAAGRTTTGLTFRHPLLRRTCYELLTRLRSRQLHAAWGEAVLRHRPHDADALASHLWQAEDPRAADHLRQAAERAAGLYANEAADTYYRRLLPLVAGDPPLAAEVGLDHGVVLHRMSRYEEAADVLRTALDAARRADDADAADAAVTITARLAEALVRMGRHEEARLALDASRPGPGTAADAVAAHRLAQAISLFAEGRHAEAVKPATVSARAAARLAGRSGSRALARALAQQAAALGMVHRLPEAQEVAQEALRHAVAGEDPAVEAIVLSILRENCRRTGRLTEALAHGEAAARLADRVGSPEAQSFERTNLAELHLLLDRAPEAEELARAAVRTARQQAERPLPFACAALARILMTREPDEARALLADGEAVAERTGEQQALDEVLLAQAELALRTGRPGSALELLDRVTSSPRAACVRGWALIRTGRREQAAALLEAEAVRAEQAGQQLLAVETTTALALALGLCGESERSEAAFAASRDAAASLPYPLGLTRIRIAQEELSRSQP
ncbi:AAA family ATPase [Streptomyces sp. NPDC051921]|uniref:ATP-binding protein n=1 Tax=Streptomyces sp. NPDC051921 TaxID=3155806 RepID=UPI00344A0ECC